VELFMPEMLIGIAFAALIVALPYLHEKISGNFRIFPLRRKEVEEKMKEVDRALEEVVNMGVRQKAEEKVVPLEGENPVNNPANIDFDSNLLEEMEAGTQIKAENAEEEQKLPEIPELPEIKVEEEVKAESESEDKDKEEVKTVDFDEHDELLSSIVKDIDKKEEEEVDLLRELKGQKFSAEELESELREVLAKFKALSGGK